MKAKDLVFSLKGNFVSWIPSPVLWDSEGKSAPISKLELFLTEWSRSYIVLALSKKSVFINGLVTLDLDSFSYCSKFQACLNEHEQSWNFLNKLNAVLD